MAYDCKLKQHVAVKIFKKKQMTIQAIRAAKLEKRLMERLDHANVMKLLDYFEDGDFICMVMDLMVDDMRNLMILNPGSFEEKFAKSVFQMRDRSVTPTSANIPAVSSI